MPQSARFAAVKSPTLLICLTASSLLVALAALQWTLIDWITPFLMLPVQSAAWLFFVVSLILAMVAAVRGRRSPARALVPLAVCILTIALLATTPFTRIWLATNFHFKQSARETVVREVANGKLHPNVKHNAALIALSSHPNLSAGGNEVVFQQSSRGPFVFFFTFRGILGSASGFLWVPPGASPNEFRLFNEELGEVIAYAPNWYFISAAR
jgi:hypothetical protein